MTYCLVYEQSIIVTTSETTATKAAYDIPCPDWLRRVSKAFSLLPCSLALSLSLSLSLSPSRYFWIWK